jgi:hypothetical protein
MFYFYRGQNSPTIWAINAITLVIYKKLQEIDNRPMGENSPNLVAQHGGAAGMMPFPEIADF